MATEGTQRARIFLRRSYEQPDAHGVSSNSGLPSRPLVYSCGEKMSMSLLLTHESTIIGFEASEAAAYLARVGVRVRVRVRVRVSG